MLQDLKPRSHEYYRVSPSHKRGQGECVLCPRRETVGYYRGITSSIWAPVPTESVIFVQKQASRTGRVRTFFTLSECLYTRKALIATSLPPYFPRHISASPPDATASSPRFSSPVESMADVGSCTVILHTFPKADMYFTFCGLTVGYTYTETTEGRFRGERNEEYRQT